MRKSEVESILIANWYFTKCKMENPTSDKTETARNYLTQKVNKAILNRDSIKYNKAFLLSVISIFILLVS